jgi:DNA-binding MarR family transcriptional regulator
MTEQSDHPASRLDDVVHQRVRLGVLTIAHEARRVEFGYLRTHLELTAGNLSQHLAVLASAGLIAVEKGYEGRRPRTWISLTKAGRVALAEEITQLKGLITRVEQADSPRKARSSTVSVPRSAS